MYENSKIFAEENNIKVKQVAGFLRAAITASHISPSIFKVMEVFGKDVVMERLNLSVSLDYVRI